MQRELKWSENLEELIKGDSVLEKCKGLLTINSLTQGLKQVNSRFNVEILHSGETVGYVDEGFTKEDRLFSREVYLSLMNINVVWARSVCQQKSVNWLKILDCGIEPLGYKLFDGSLPITRTVFEYAFIPLAHPMLPVEITAEHSQKSMIARRSFFKWGDDRLLLIECYSDHLIPLLKN